MSRYIQYKEERSTRTSVNASGVKTPKIYCKALFICVCCSESTCTKYTCGSDHTDTTRSSKICSLNHFWNIVCRIETAAVKQILNKSLYVIIMTRRQQLMNTNVTLFYIQVYRAVPPPPLFLHVHVSSSHLTSLSPPFFFHLSTPSLHPFLPFFIAHFHSFPFLHHPRCWLPPPPTNRQQWRTVLLPDQALSQLHPTHHGPWAGCLGGVQGNAVSAGEAGAGLLWGRLDGWEQQRQPLTPSTDLERELSVQRRPL